MVRCRSGIQSKVTRKALARNNMVTIEQLRELVAIQAEDHALWAPATHAETAYVQQALRFLTHAIESEWTFEQASRMIREMAP